MSKLLEIKNLSRAHAHPSGNITVLDAASFSLNKGEVVALVGPSGSGKSTFLQLVGLLDTPDSGEILLNGQPLQNASDAVRTKTRNAHFGFIYQFHHLLPEFTALENVMMPAWLAGVDSPAKAETLLHGFGLQHRTHHMPTELSGGEQQRVAIARALMNAPDILLADEPTGNLDPATSKQVIDAILDNAKQLGMAAIIATHNHAIAARMHRAITIRAGRIEPIEVRG